VWVEVVVVVEELLQSGMGAPAMSRFLLRLRNRGFRVRVPLLCCCGLWGIVWVRWGDAKVDDVTQGCARAS
jgi:hypothetical protein